MGSRMSLRSRWLRFRHEHAYTLRLVVPLLVMLAVIFTVLHTLPHTMYGVDWHKTAHLQH